MSFKVTGTDGSVQEDAKKEIYETDMRLKGIEQIVEKSRELLKQQMEEVQKAVDTLEHTEKRIRKIEKDNTWKEVGTAVLTAIVIAIVIFKIYGGRTVT